MANVTYDDRSFLIDGKRVWLVSGSVHYFRTPSALWADRLLKAKRGGLNCIATPVPWNFHELREGQWDFTGDRDLAGFVRLAEELGLYVILQPGPYIGGDWDFGGLPGWPSAKSGIAYRTSNAAYTHYLDKYFRQVLTRLADLQVTRGGNIILVQNENQYVMTTMPDRVNYLGFINQLFRRSGFEVPILANNEFSEPAAPDAIETVGGAGREIQQLKRLRGRQGNAPLLMTALWTGQGDVWGSKHEGCDGRELARRALEVLGCGAQYNYYLWGGGTNLEFWSSRVSAGESSYVMTSYDLDAPVAEGGGLTEKFYWARLVNTLAGTMGAYLAGAAMESRGVSVHDSTSVGNIAGPMGRWAVVSNGGKGEIQTARISLPDGEELTVSLAPLGAVAVPIDLSLLPAVRLDYANVMPLGLFGDKVLVFHGPAGWDARISINDKEIVAKVPSGGQPLVIPQADVIVVLVNTDAAMRAWHVGDQLIFGPDFVGATGEDIVDAPGAKDYAVLSLVDGEMTSRKAGGAKAHHPAPPRLGAWKRTSVCVEPVSATLTWQKMDRPRDVDHLGIHYGYVWYRAEVNEPRATKRRLFLPQCEDRATIYLNGELLGVWGRGAGAEREPVKASFRSGVNVLTVLADNLGRFSDEPCLGGLKGLFGHIYDATPLAVSRFKIAPYPCFTRRMIPRAMTHLGAELERGPIFAADIPLALPTVVPVHVSFKDLPHHAIVMCNNRVAGFFPRNPSGLNFGDVTLGAELKKGKNNLQVLLWGPVDPKTIEKIRLHLLGENVTESAQWGYRPLAMPAEGGHVVGKDQPAWYVSQFKGPQSPTPLFLHLIGAKKGQVFLNGHNVGRFWTVGPQQHYYLPSCWLKELNEVMVFEDHGLIPARSSLEFRPLGPYR